MSHKLAHFTEKAAEGHGWETSQIEYTAKMLHDAAIELAHTPRAAEEHLLGDQLAFIDDLKKMSSVLFKIFLTDGSKITLPHLTIDRTSDRIVFESQGDDVQTSIVLNAVQKITLIGKGPQNFYREQSFSPPEFRTIAQKYSLIPQYHEDLTGLFGEKGTSGV